MEIIIITGNIAFERSEFISMCVEEGTKVALAKRLGCSRPSLSKCIEKYFPDLRKGARLGNAILEKENLKKCSSCETIQPLEEFYERSDKSVYAYCKSCHKSKSNKWERENPNKVRAKKARRKASKIQRTPAWADLEKIKEIYMNCPEGHHVDHIIPLQGETVSGLHVETNLQYLTAEENLRKGNKFK